MRKDPTAVEAARTMARARWDRYVQRPEVRADILAAVARSLTRLAPLTGAEARPLWELLPPARGEGEG